MQIADPDLNVIFTFIHKPDKFFQSKFVKNSTFYQKSVKRNQIGYDLVVFDFAYT